MLPNILSDGNALLFGRWEKYRKPRKSSSQRQRNIKRWAIRLKGRLSLLVSERELYIKYISTV